MTDMSAFVQKPGYLGVAPTYTAVTAADKFLAVRGAKYMLHYKNGATAQTTGPNKVTDQTSLAPAGSSPTAGSFDALTSGGSGMGATSELVAWIDNSTRFMDGQNFINLVHPGTLTTVTVAIFGPF
jgi:hypothetical protein